jgi:type IV pilus assembly protein PilV
MITRSMVAPAIRPKVFGPVRCTQSGVGLIEVLIAVLILAVGILGLAQMQLSAKRASFEATQRSIATSLARDILERIRSNPGEVATYAAAPNDEIVLTAAYTLPTVTDCTTTACTAAQLVAYDMRDWTEMVRGDRIKVGAVAAGGLLNPVVCMFENSSVVTVVLAWQGINEIDQTILDDPTDLGGNSLGECGDGQFGTDDKLRRQLTMSTFVVAI